jgi:peptide/nickel transport system substrate-binding protein
VLHLDPGTGKLRREISVATPPTSLAAGLGGVWALGTNPSRSGATLQRIDPAYDTSTEHVELAGLARGNEGGGVAAGEGAVWVAPGGVDPVLQLDPKSLAVVRRIDPVTCCPSGVAVGLGAVWVIDRVSGLVVRIDPGTGLSKTTTVGDGPSAVAVGEGAVWVANGDDGTVSRIDPRNAAVTTTIGVGRSPSAVATGGGSVWVANSKDGTVTRIDPDTNAPVRTIPVGGSPQRLAYAYGKLWVSVEQQAGEATVADEAVSFRSESGPDTLDPALAYTPIERSSLKGSTSLSWQIEYATCAKLVNYPDRRGPVGTQLVPEVAAALPKLSDRGRKYTFTIRKGFRFSPPSGAPVTAQTVRYSVERALSPRLAGPARRGRVAPLHGRGVLDDVVGAEAFESGRAKHIRGLTASGNKLTFALEAPAPDLLARLAMPFFCVVPQNTPVAEGVRTVPAAGPYYVKSFVPDQKIVLERNPNYQGSRPHQLKEIEVTLGEPRAQTVAQIENARVDYSLDGVPTAAAARLNERYGPGSAAARAGKQQFFVNPTLQNFYLALNTSRRAFSDVKRRRAVNYVIDRRVLAVLLTRFGISARATDQHLPPPMPGFRNTSVYPSIADPQKALRLSRKRVKAVLYSCGACGDADQVLQTYLATIGIELEVKRFPITTLTEKVGKRGEPFDVTFAAWSTEYLDPAAFLDVLLNGNHIRATQNFNISYFNNPSYNRKLEKAAKLNGRARYDAYGKLDVELASKAAPMAPLVNLTRQDFFSARMGCQIYNPLYGMDIAALCVRK